MADLLMRRREMVIPFQQKEWDYEWDASMGLLDANGWTATKVGTSSSTKKSIVSDYMSLYTNSSNYYNFTYPNTYTKCVIQVVIYFPNNSIIRVNAPGDSNDYSLGIRIQRSDNYNGVYIGTSTSGTKLATTNYNTKYTVSVVINEGVGQVWRDGVLLGDNIDTTSISGVGGGFIRMCGAGNTWRTLRLYSVKMKFGRI